MYYSIVVPIHNEEENLRELVEEVELVMGKMGQPWEMICVEDGSTDRSLSLLQQLSLEKAFLRILVFSRRFGQSAAMAAGFEAARGKVVITLDGDRQNDPQDIPKLTAALADCDLVVGWRKERKDTWKKRITSRFSNSIRSHLCQDHVHDTGCSLKAYRREALQKIKLYKGMHRFLPALFKIEGFTVKEVPVHHRNRVKGKTKYHLGNRFLAPILDMFVVMWMRRRALNYRIREELPLDE